MGFLAGAEPIGLSHGELAEHLDGHGQELFRWLLDDHVALRRARERLEEAGGNEGKVRGWQQGAKRRWTCWWANTRSLRSHGDVTQTASAIPIRKRAGTLCAQGQASHLIPANLSQTDRATQRTPASRELVG